MPDARGGRPAPTPGADAQVTLRRVEALADDWGNQRRERQRRRELDTAAFDLLTEAGFSLSGVPADMGGTFQHVSRSVRGVGELLRVLARGDSSVALVAAMHPTVLSFWLATPAVPEPFQAAWDEQRRHIFQSVLAGGWWGTLTSEPGGGGDLAQTRAVAKPVGSGYQLFGDKGFGSGSGMTDYMMTVAIPEGEGQPDLFYLDVRGARHGSTGMRLVDAWDGHGMIATQSHSYHFDGYPVVRAAWPGNLPALGAAAQPYIRCCFSAVFVGIVETALSTARDQLMKRSALRPFEQVEWARAEMEAWQVAQAYEGMLRAVEAGGSGTGRATIYGKLAVAELSEAVLTRLCRIIGGSSFARSSPFGHWAQDVRALGFLRPPWALAFDTLLDPLVTVVSTAALGQPPVP